MTTEEFIEKAKAVHGDKYDYSKVEYVNIKTKVCIICQEHGEFWQRAESHLRRCGCFQCADDKKKETQRIWTYERCCIEAKKYQTKTQFLKGCPSAFRRAQKAGWLKEYSWFVSGHRLEGEMRKKWTYESCFAEAQKYNTKNEFREKNSSAYSIACKNGWIFDYDWLIDKRLRLITDKIDCVYAYYFKQTHTIYIGRTINKKSRDYQHIFTTDNDTVAKYAKQLKCSVPPMVILEDGLTLKEGQEKEDYWKNYYAENGYNILNKGATGLGRGSLGALGFGKWTRTACYEEAKKYSSRSEFKLANGSAYSAASKKGWLGEYVWFTELKTPKSYWTYERCYAEAQKYQTKKQFYKANDRAYRIAFENGWIKDYTWFRKPTPIVKWTYEACMGKAQTCHSKVEFETKFPGAMNVARKNNWLKDSRFLWLVKNVLQCSWQAVREADSVY